MANKSKRSPQIARMAKLVKIVQNNKMVSARLAWLAENAGKFVIQSDRAYQIQSNGSYRRLDNAEEKSARSEIKVS